MEEFFVNAKTWFDAMSGPEQTFWAVAIIASAIFAIQAILTLIGMDTDADMDFNFTDGDTMDTGGAMSLFSIRSMVNFFFGFGWAGVTFFGSLEPLWLVYLVSVLIGMLFSFCCILLGKKLLKLERNGAMNINECIGMEGNVYLRIPAERKGKGKLQISINGSIHELDAMTNGEELKSGSLARVSAIESNVLIVEGI